MQVIVGFNKNSHQVNTIKPHATAVFKSGKTSRSGLSDWRSSPFSRDRYAPVSNRISTERASASSEFCKSSRNTVLIAAMSKRATHGILGKRDGPVNCPE
jgi:hypothetical protein